MSNPVLVEVTRGPLVESRHRGAIAICRADGATLWATGDVGGSVFPRSAVKAIQALPLVESGAADRFGFGDRELALAQGSHSGEPEHVETARSMLSRIGLDERALECGAHPPLNAGAREQLAKAGGSPSPLHNNCSGKHAGFLAVAVHLQVPTVGYVQPDHPVQVLVREALAELTGAAHPPSVRGTDGCSIPTYAVPLDNLARGFARFAAASGIPPGRGQAARRIHQAAIAKPFHVAGTGRFCTEAMQGLQGAALIKTGAEGVFCAALPGCGLGVALKIDDGATRASEVALAAILARLMPERAKGLGPWLPRAVESVRGAKVGEIRPIAAAFAGLTPPG